MEQRRGGGTWWGGVCRGWTPPPRVEPTLEETTLLRKIERRFVFRNAQWNCDDIYSHKEGRAGIVYESGGDTPGSDTGN